jgi:hypothetical protein
MALTREDWNFYAGRPNEFFAAPGDRILHEEIPEQVELFWADFLEGRNGTGFRKIDCPENRELLLRKYADTTGNALVVRSALNALWRKYVITGSALDHFINPHEDEMVEQIAREQEESERPRDATGRLMSPKAIQWQKWEVWVNDPETPMKAILEQRRLNPQFAEFYAHYSAAERTTPVFDSVENLNVRQPAPSSKRVASPEVQQFAEEYRTLSSQAVKTLLSPGLNPLGPAAAAKNNELFSQACAFGLI